MIEILLEGKGMNFFLVLFSFTTIGYTIWAIPMLSIYLLKLFNSQNSIERSYKKLIAHYNSLNTESNYYLPIRYFSTLPLVLLGIAVNISGINYQKNYSGWYYLIIPIYLGLFIGFYFIFPLVFRWISNFYLKFYSFYSMREKIYAMHIFNLCMYVLLCLLFMIFYQIISPSIFQFHVFVIGFIYIFACWHYTALYYLEHHTYLASKDQIKDFFSGYTRNRAINLNPDKKTSIRAANFTYLLLFAQSALFIGILMHYTKNGNLFSFSPLFILIIFLQAFLMLFDNFYKGINIILYKSKDQKNIVIDFCLKLIMLLFCFVLIFYESNDHRIRVIEDTDNQYSPLDRVSSLDYFKQWDARRKIASSKDSAQKNTIFIIAGQGGGSKAACWIHYNLNYLDSAFGLSKNTFAYGSASGSTVGINYKLAEWRLAQALKIPTCEPPNSEKLKKLYGTNFFSSSFYGIMWGDMIDSWNGRLFARNRLFDKDRNYQLQKEEFIGFKNAFKEFSLIDKEKFNRVLDLHFEADYLSFNYPKDAFIQQYIPSPSPLFFINTTFMQRGDRCTFMPITTDPNKYYAYDIYKVIKDNLKKDFKTTTLPAIVTVNQSQAVPILNSMNFVKGFGNLADGGIADNSGCGSLIDLYSELRSSISKEYKIVVLYFQNSNDFRSEEAEKNAKNALFFSLNGAINVGLTSNAAYWPNKLEQIIQNQNKPGCQDTFIRFTMKYNSPVSRSLTQAALDSIYVSMLEVENKSKLDLVRKMIPR
jgi:hypothetical protein